MKIYIKIIFLFSVFFSTLNAQEAVIIHDNDSLDMIESDHIIRREIKDTVPANPVSIYGWTISRRLGERTIVERDTARVNFHQTGLIDSKEITVSYLSNVGSPAQSKIFFNREESSLFNFLNAFDYYYIKPDNKVFLNTKIPYSNIFYQRTEGKGQNREERFSTELSWNINKKLNIGFDIDYIYSRGYYNSLASKQFAYNIYASYIGKKYEMHAFAYNNNFLNSENGGLADDNTITDPDLSQTFRNSKDIETKFSDAWNRVKGRQIYVNNRYNLGINEEDSISIPIASLILTSYYADQQRYFVSRDESTSYEGPSGLITETDLAYLDAENNYKNPADDKMAYWSWKNTFGISLNEGFKEWVKFGLTAYIEQDIRRFKQPFFSKEVSHTINQPGSRIENQNSTVIGAVLSKTKGKFLRYNLSADLGVIGYNIGEFRVNGNLKTLINIKGKQAEVSATAYIKNLKPTFFENTFYSKYFSWDNDFSDVRRFYVGGEIYLPQTKTRIKGGVENIQNYIYYGSDKYIAQEGASVQVISIQLEQNLNAGILHWDNKLAYQTTTNSDVIPLPTLSAYSNLYLLTSISKVLTVQLGVDAHYFTEYYAPGYEPALLQFYNQKEKKIGNFPIATGYINLHLKNTRFFLMFYNIGKSLGSSNYFTTPHYPVNPMIFKLGLSWDFNN